MQSGNLIPSHRLEARRRRRRLRTWAGIVPAYAVLLAAAYAACLIAWGVDADALAGKQNAARQRAEQARKQIAETQAALAEVRRTLRANEAVAGHPDWSLLLILLANSMNEGVVLGQCRLGPDKGPEGSPAAEAPAREPPAGTWRLEVSGYGRSVTSVSQFALALERTGLFNEVRLMKTVRQPFLAGLATHFQIHCALGAGSRSEESS